MSYGPIAGKYRKLGKKQLELTSDYGPYPRSQFDWADDSLGVPHFFLFVPTPKNAGILDWKRECSKHRIVLAELDENDSIIHKSQFPFNRRHVKFHKDTNYILFIYFYDHEHQGALRLHVPLQYRISGNELSKMGPQKLTLAIDFDDLYTYLPIERDTIELVRKKKQFYSIGLGEDGVDVHEVVETTW